MKITNLTGHQKCWTCEDQAVIEVPATDWPGREPAVMAPCPFCERGVRLEYNGDWGRDGYWRGDLPEQKFFADSGELSKDERLRHLRMLAVSLRAMPS